VIVRVAAFRVVLELPERDGRIQRHERGLGRGDAVALRPIVGLGEIDEIRDAYRRGVREIEGGDIAIRARLDGPALHATARETRSGHAETDGDDEQEAAHR
jgi:hypothetical protein